MQLARRAARAGSHLRDARPDEIARLHHQKLRPIQPADAVAQRAVASVRRVVIRDGADPGDVIPDQNPQPVAVRRPFRRDEELRLAPAALDAKHHWLRRLDRIQKQVLHALST